MNTTIEHRPLNITSKQRANLLTLAEYLLQPVLEARFDMADYGDEDLDEGSTTCGTVGCAAGHGPYAGIAKSPGEHWGQYAHRCFTSGDDELWGWLFEYRWSEYDNTSDGAAKRILYALQRGTPTGIRFVDAVPLYEGMTL